jgi:hypothetical protein
MWVALVAQTGDAHAGAKRDEIAGLLDEERLEKARAAAAEARHEDRRTP